MKILVLTQDYPRLNGTHERMYVHVRNLFYQKKGIEVTVLNFSTNIKYEIDGIKVISEKDYYSSCNNYDILVAHAVNIKNHFRFLVKNYNRFTNIVIFFHGHEIMKMNRDYPSPYPYMNGNNIIYKHFRNIYDEFKIILLKRLFKKINYKTNFIFVSQYIYNKYKENFKLHYDEMKENEHIINNSVGEIFEKESYNLNEKKIYDFITIRSNLDGSTYCIDLLTKIANKYPNKKFLLIGKGKFFEHYNKPSNIVWMDKTLNHVELVSYLNKSKAAIQLTRHDTQGVMSCELATFGIPLITSDIEVCMEFFSKMENVKMISNDVENENLDELLNEIKAENNKKDYYFSCNTIYKEVKLFNNILKGDKDEKNIKI